MEIRRIEYKNVHGSLTGELDFSRGENFLVGINGCGKTTVLNLIRWVLGPCFPELFMLQHESITIDIKHGKYMYSIQSYITEDGHVLEVVTKDKSRDFNPIVTPLSIHQRQVRGRLEEVQEMYENLVPEQHEMSTWSFLTEELPSPVFIGLQRSIDDTPSPKRLSRKYSNSSEGGAPLRTATTLMRDAFNTGRRKLVEINDELNRKVLELSFSGVISSNLNTTPVPSKITAKKIKRLKARFDSTTDKGAYSKALSATEVRTAIVKYLNELSSILSDEGEIGDVWITLNQHNFNRAASMFDLFEKHERKAQDAQQEIIGFSAAVNKFIGDSGKYITFDEDTGTPYFMIQDSTESLKLSELSSGEAQVVVLLSYFAFLAKKGIPIVIDEPELSLHVQWQKYFVNAVKEVLPGECQTIMATHSPEICGADEVNVQSISVRTAQ